MLNQLEDNHHATYSIRFTNTTDDEIVGKVTDREKVPDGWGRPTFMAHSDLKYKPAKNCQYLRYDCLRFQIVNFELKWELFLTQLTHMYKGDLKLTVRSASVVVLIKSHVKK